MYYLPELQPMVLRCVGDAAAAQTVVDEVLRRAAPCAGDVSLPPAVVRLELFSITRDLLRERARDQWSAQHDAAASAGDVGVSPV